MDVRSSRMRLAFAVLLCGVSAVNGGSPAPTASAGFAGAFYVGERRSGDSPAVHAMLDLAAGGPVTLRWGLSCTAGSANGTSGCEQQSFSVVVREADGGAVVVRSGVVASQAQRYTLPGSDALTPATRYTWAVSANVSVTAGAGAATTAIVSAEHYFFTAPGAWQAAPIWAPKNASGGWPTFSLLRYASVAGAAKTPPRTVASGVLFVTANVPTANKESSGAAPGKTPRPPKVLAAYKLWVQDVLIGMGPGRGRCSPGVVCDGQPFGAVEQVYDGFDVTPQLAGVAENAVALFVTGFGIDQSQGPFASGRPKLILELHLRFTDNSSAVIATGGGGAWEAFDADPVYDPRGNSGCAWYWYPQENFNATRAPPGTPLRPVAAQHGLAAAAGWTPAVEQPAFAAPLVAKPVAPVAVLTQDEADINVTQLAPGRFFVDLGREMQGGLRVTLRAGAAVVQVTAAEELSGPGAVLYPPRTGTAPRVTWALDATAGAPTAEHHEYLEFRYAELLFANATAKAFIESGDFSVSAWKVHLPYDTPRSAEFASSSAPLNAVWELSRYTIEASSLDLYADSNARQRSADCAADDITALQSQLASTGELALPRFALEQLLANAPADRVDWAVLPIIGIWEHMMHSGDTALAAATFDHAVANLSCLDSVSNASGLVENEEPLVDWPTGMQDRYVKSKTSTIASAWVYYGATTLERIARALNRTADAERLKERAAALKAAMNAQQWNATAGAFCDGVCTDTPHMAFHSTVYALAFDAVTDEHAKQAWAYVRSRIDPPFNGTAATEAKTASADGASWPPPPPPGEHDGMPCGVYPSQFVLTALYQNQADQGAAALAVLTSNAKNTWLSMLAQGATMTMEMWAPDEKPNLTWSHPWASSPAFVIAWYLFGIRPLEPGFTRVAIKPQVGALASGRYVLPTVLGPISVSFGQTKRAFDLHVSLPAGAAGEVAVPLPRRIAAAAAKGVVAPLQVDGAPVAASVDGGFAVVHLRGGAHHIRADESLLGL